MDALLTVALEEAAPLVLDPGTSVQTSMALLERVFADRVSDDDARRILTVVTLNRFPDDAVFRMVRAARMCVCVCMCAQDVLSDVCVHVCMCVRAYGAQYLDLLEVADWCTGALIDFGPQMACSDEQRSSALLSAVEQVLVRDSRCAVQGLAAMAELESVVGNTVRVLSRWAARMCS